MELSGTESTRSINSECDCYYCQLGMNNQSAMEGYPYYPCSAIQQPLVYYAQCDHGKLKDCKECKRSNCFVKAFRWYTREHKTQRQKGRPCKDQYPCPEPCSDECSDPDGKGTTYNQTDVGAFASWLDTKYQQFLFEKNAKGACHIKLTQTSLTEDYNQTPREYYESFARKRFAVKNRWLRRKQKCDERQCPKNFQSQERNQPKSNNISMEFILTPKNLSHAVSECGHATATCSFDRHIARSRSATATVCLNKSSCNDNQKFVKPPFEQRLSVNDSKLRKEFKDTSCQCVPQPGQSVQTQYENSSTTTVIIQESQNSKTKKLSQPENVRCATETRKENITPQRDSKKLQQKPSMKFLKRKDTNNVTCMCPSGEKTMLQNNTEVKFDPHSQLCPDFQKPCPSRFPSTNDEKACTSLNEPCPGRRPCPSLYQTCPPCPVTNYQQAEVPIIRQEISVESKQLIQTKATDSGTSCVRGPCSQVPDVQKECCPEPDFQDACTGSYSTPVRRDSSLVQTTRLKTSECHCVNCYRSGVNFDSTKCCILPPHGLMPQQNVIINATEGKCSVNCPYYSSISNKAGTTQTETTPNVQFSESSNKFIQTSSTAIHLNRNNPEYKLFMRVVRAEKLKS